MWNANARVQAVAAPLDRSSIEVWCARQLLLFAVPRQCDSTMTMQTNPFRPNSTATLDVFVGRTNELSKLVGLLQEVASGRTHQVRILGERGIGKTSLLRVLESYARGEHRYTDKKLEVVS